LGDGLLDGGEIGEGAAEPTFANVSRAAALRELLDDLLRLLLAADEEDLVALGREIAKEIGGLFELLGRLIQVNDVDPVTRLEDEGLHLRIPALRPMAEVHSGVHQFFYINLSHIHQ